MFKAARPAEIAFLSTTGRPIGTGAGGRARFVAAFALGMVCIGVVPASALAQPATPKPPGAAPPALPRSGADPARTAPAPSETPARPAASGPAAPGRPKIPPLQDTERKLAGATDSQAARTLEQKAEALRQRMVSPTSQLLMRDAQHALEQHDMKTAEASMDDAIVLQPEAGVLWRARAQVRADAGDFAGAIADLGVALDRDPGDLNAWTMLSDTETDRHDAAAAYDAYQHVLTLDPLVTDGRVRLDKLKIARDGQPL